MIEHVYVNVHAILLLAVCAQPTVTLLRMLWLKALQSVQQLLLR